MPAARGSLVCNGTLDAYELSQVKCNPFLSLQTTASEAPPLQQQPVQTRLGAWGLPQVLDDLFYDAQSVPSLSLAFQ